MFPINHNTARRLQSTAAVAKTEYTRLSLAVEPNAAQQPAAAGRVAAWFCGPREYGKLIGDSTRMTMARAATTVRAVSRGCRKIGIREMQKLAMRPRNWTGYRHS
jgi:hypothetical protein